MEILWIELTSEFNGLFFGNSDAPAGKLLAFCEIFKIKFFFHRFSFFI